MRERLVQEFWRNWDASLNRWLVRYLYVPLGGREAAARNALICFLFAAILVGPDGRMLAWAGCASAAFCLELVSYGGQCICLHCPALARYLAPALVSMGLLRCSQCPAPGLMSAHS